MAQEKSKTGYSCTISRQGRTYQESVDLTYKEGVAGSNPASPTLEKALLQEKLREVRKSRADSRLFDDHLTTARIASGK